MTTQPEKLCAWLTDLKVGNVTPLAFRIGRTSYPCAASYTDMHDRRIVYVVGKLPASYRHRPRSTCFRFADSVHDWYVASYMEGARITPENAKYHPWGETFLLAPWDHSEPIDRYEKGPRRRASIVALDRS